MQPANLPQFPRSEGRDREQALQLLQEREVQGLRLQVSDLFGAPWSVEVPPERFAAALDGGIRFHGSATEGFVRPEQNDLFLRPDLDTLRAFPSEPGEGGQALLICDVHRADGTPFEGDPRGALKRVLAWLGEEGYQVRVGAETEFVVLGGPGAPASEGGQPGEEVRHHAVRLLRGMGVQVDAAHREVAPGQHEIDLAAGPALRVADDLAVMRQAIRRAAAARGWQATFMPKPVVGQNGSGLHLHLSLWRAEQNAFFDPEARDRLSQLLRFWLGGLLRHARGYCAVTNPLVNSYKRLVPGYEAPVAVAWSLHNRAPLVRVPAGRGDATRCEVLLPDPAANPYLALAALLAAGLDGVRHETNPGEPLNKDLDRISARERQRLKVADIPRDLGEALTELEQSALVRRALGEHIFSHYTEAKRAEWREYQAQVHAWEVERYL